MVHELRHVPARYVCRALRLDSLPASAIGIDKKGDVDLSPIWLGLGAFTAFGPELFGAFYYKVHWKLNTLAWMISHPAGSLFYISAILSFLAFRRIGSSSWLRSPRWGGWRSRFICFNPL